jgi:hypothetical protein
VAFYEFFVLAVNGRHFQDFMERQARYTIGSGMAKTRTIREYVENWFNGV